jgi:hypothetical protein
MATKAKTEKTKEKKKREKEKRKRKENHTLSDLRKHEPRIMSYLASTQRCLR